MDTDFEALVWDFRVAMTLHRIADARLTLDGALRLSNDRGADRGARFSLVLDAATLAQFSGDLPGARRYGEQLAGVSQDDALHRFWAGCYKVRQATLLGRLDDAAAHANGMIEAAASSSVGPARRSAAIAELAWVQARLGRLPEAIGLYETACDGLIRLGSHPEWASDFLFEQARLQVQEARGHEHRSFGGLGGAQAGGDSTSQALWRRASATLEAAQGQHAPGWNDGLLATSAAALRGITLMAGAPSDAAVEAFGELAGAYDTHRMLEPFVWSACELARLHLQRDDPGMALQVLVRVRNRLPPSGFASMHEQLDFVDSMVHRRQGDYRRALIAYQRYAQRAFERSANVPAAFVDGTLSGRAMQLTQSTRGRPADFSRATGFGFGFGVATMAGAVGPELEGASGAASAGSAAEALLTVREREVMQMVCEGLVNRQIASFMRLSTPTVRNHLASIFRKLHVTSRAEAAKVFRSATEVAEVAEA